MTTVSEIMSRWCLTFDAVSIRNNDISVLFGRDMWCIAVKLEYFCTVYINVSK